MKVRKGFVSNSSSSSYICDACNESEVSYEGLAEIEMFQCTSGHTLHENCGVNFKAPDEPEEPIRGDYETNTLYVEALDKYDKDKEAWDDDWRWDGCAATDKFCSLCSLTNIDDNTRSRYLGAVAQLTSDQVDEVIRKKFSNYDELNAWLTSNEVK